MSTTSNKVVTHAQAVTDLNRAVTACSLGVLGEVLTKKRETSFQTALNTAVGYWLEEHVKQWPFLGCGEVSVTVVTDRDMFELKMSDTLKSFVDGRTE